MLLSLFQQLPLNYSKYAYWHHLWTSEHKSTCCDPARSDNTLPCLLDHTSNKWNPLKLSGLCYNDWIIICIILARTAVYYAELLIKCCVWLVGASCLDSLDKATLMSSRGINTSNITRKLGFVPNAKYGKWRPLILCRRSRKLIFLHASLYEAVMSVSFAI